MKSFVFDFNSNYVYSYFKSYDWTNQLHDILYYVLFIDGFQTRPQRNQTVVAVLGNYILKLNNNIRISYAQMNVHSSMVSDLTAKNFTTYT